MEKNRAKILEEKKWLFKKWALIRIEEVIDKSIDKILSILKLS
jgi:hypothetical protein